MRTAPRKQRHTAHRIWERIRQERLGHRRGSDRAADVREGKQKLGLTGRETWCRKSTTGAARRRWMPVRSHGRLLRGRTIAGLHVCDALNGQWGSVFTWPTDHAHNRPFWKRTSWHLTISVACSAACATTTWKTAVKKIRRGHQREETERLIAFRSHWGFKTEFCNPARGNEKGGVEGEVRLLRRKPSGLPGPQAQNLEELKQHRQLLPARQQRRMTVGRRRRGRHAGRSYAAAAAVRGRIRPGGSAFSRQWTARAA